jgi:hypothetical protein
MKYELRIEFYKNEELKKLIEQSYFEAGTMGKLLGQKYSLAIQKEDPLYIIFKGLNNMTVRLHNTELIEGSMRMVIDEHEWGVNLFPCSIYCIVEDEKYSFY